MPSPISSAGSPQTSLATGTEYNAVMAATSRHIDRKTREAPCADSADMSRVPWHFRAASTARSSPRRRNLALGDAAVAVTGTSAALAAGELEAARELAEQIGIRHVVLPTEEFANPSYVANTPDRCYHCKSELYSQLGNIAERLGVASRRQRRKCR